MAQRNIKYTTEEWVEKAKQKYPNIIYDNVVYIDKKTKVELVCPKHGVFYARPNRFLGGNEYCIECNKEKRLKEEANKVIGEIKEITKDFNYIFYPESFKGMAKPMDVYCGEHGMFHPTPANMLFNKSICRKCSERINGLKRRMAIDEFIEKAHEVHGDKYQYDKSVYAGNMLKMIITCPIHGDFMQTPHNHLSGQGCPKCGLNIISEKGRCKQDDIIERFKEKHKNPYLDYSQFVYNGFDVKSVIICHKTDKNGVEHGKFLQSAGLHLSGCGCPKCSESRLERRIRILLTENNIVYTPQMSKKDGFVWLGKQSLDFYLPDRNIAIECQGWQHFIKLKEYDDVATNKERDFRKKQKCRENGVKLIYFLDKNFVQYLEPDDIYATNEKELLDFLK